MEVALGKPFGRYLVEALLGQGGMGRVFKAQDTVLERPVALKVILPDQASDPEAVARFFREAKLAAKLTHANTVRVYDLGEVERVPYIAMELIDGRTLSSFAGDTTVGPLRRLSWMLGVARGLAAAHERGLLHRDVRPGNVMISVVDDVAKIVDFGLAKRIVMSPALKATFRTPLGHVLGTPAYMAPEALAGGHSDARSDQFSWALTTYTAVTGRNPRANDPILERPVPLLSELAPAISPRAGHVVLRALTLEPDLRYGTMDELAEDLADGLLSRSIAPPTIRQSRFPSEPEPVVNAQPEQTKQSPLQPDGERLRMEDNARTCVKRLAYIEKHRFAVVHGFTHHKQDVALEGTPLPEAISKESWTFSVVRPRCPAELLRFAVISPDGNTAFAIGPAHGTDVAVVLSGGSWSEVELSGVRERTIRCAKFLADGRLAIGGENAFAAIASLDGRVEPWSLRDRRGHAVDLGRGEFGRFVFEAVDARESKTDVELVFVGGGDATGVAATGSGGRLTRYDSAESGKLRGVVCGRVTIVAGKRLGILTETGIDCAGGSDEIRSLVHVDKKGVIALGQQRPWYFAPLATATWGELAVDAGTPIVGAAASRTEVFGVDARGTVLRRSGARTWVAVKDGVARALDPVAMWAAPGRLRIACADGSIVDASRSG